DGVETDKQIAWFNGTRGMILAISRQPGTNTVEVVDNIRKVLPELEAALPPAIELVVAFDASQSIRGSIHDVEFTLVLTVCLVVMVIFLFLRNLSATLIPGSAVVLSIIGTFAVMYLLGYSLNNLSLMALSFTPMLGSRLLPPHARKHGRLYRVLEAGFNALASAYDYSLKKALRHGMATMALAVLLLAGTVYLFRTMPTGFIPSQDSG